MRRAHPRHVAGEIEGSRIPEGERGGVAVGRVARIASRVAAVMGATAVSVQANGEDRGVAVGAAKDSSVECIGLGENGNSDESVMNSLFRVVRHASSTTNNPTARARAIANGVRRVIGMACTSGLTHVVRLYHPWDRNQSASTDGT